MEYEELNDNELVYLSCENNEEATNIIINKYKNIIVSTLLEFQKKYNFQGIELSDLYQEGLIGLLNAIESFDPKKGVLFYTYASFCVRTCMMSEIRRTFRSKNRIINYSYSLDFLYDEDNSLYDVIKDEDSNPDTILMNKEDKEEIITKVKKLLSKNELVVFDFKLNGLSNSEIAELLNKDKKYVENTVSRIIKKYKDYFK